MSANTRVIRIRREHAQIVDAVCLEHECSQTRAFEMILMGEVQPFKNPTEQSPKYPPILPESPSRREYTY